MNLVLTAPLEIPRVAMLALFSVLKCKRLKCLHLILCLYYQKVMWAKREEISLELHVLFALVLMILHFYILFSAHQGS